MVALPVPRTCLPHILRYNKTHPAGQVTVDVRNYCVSAAPRLERSCSKQDTSPEKAKETIPQGATLSPRYSLKRVSRKEVEL